MTPRNLRRHAAGAVYLLVARNLPWSFRPFGGLSARLRRFLVAHMLDACGQQVNVEHGAWFGSGRGIELGDRSDIGMNALVMGPVRIGRDVMMGPRCTLVAGAHDVRRLDVPMNTQGFLPDQPIVVEDDVWIGAASVILPGRRIGRGAIVGAGSVVTRDVPPWSVVGGNPARVLKMRDGSDQPGRP